MTNASDPATAALFPGWEELKAITMGTLGQGREKVSLGEVLSYLECTNPLQRILHVLVLAWQGKGWIDKVAAEQLIQRLSWKKLREIEAQIRKMKSEEILAQAHDNPAMISKLNKINHLEQIILSEASRRDKEAGKTAGLYSRIPLNKILQTSLFQNFIDECLFPPDELAVRQQSHRLHKQTYIRLEAEKLVCAVKDPLALKSMNDEQKRTIHAGFFEYLKEHLAEGSVDDDDLEEFESALSDPDKIIYGSIKSEYNLNNAVEKMVEFYQHLPLESLQSKQVKSFFADMIDSFKGLCAPMHAFYKKLFEAASTGDRLAAFCQVYNTREFKAYGASLSPIISLYYRFLINQEELSGSLAGLIKEARVNNPELRLDLPGFPQGENCGRILWTVIEDLPNQKKQLELLLLHHPGNPFVQGAIDAINDVLRQWFVQIKSS